MEKQVNTSQYKVRARLLRAVSLLCALLFLLSLPSIPVYAEEDDTLPVKIAAPAAAVIDVTTGDFLYLKDPDTRYQPASMTKILAALVAIENCSDLNATVTFSRNAVWGFDRKNSIHLYFDVGEQIAFKDVLCAVLLKSANEATMAMAEFTVDKAEPKNTYSGEEKVARFVEMMNECARELGAVNSHFTNPHGLQDDAQYTTARDLSLILSYAMKNDTFAAISKMRTHSIPPTNKRGQTCNFTNGNDLVRKGAGKNYTALGGHQGKATEKSGVNLITYAQNQDGANVVAVVLKGKNEENAYNDTTLLLDHYLVTCTRMYIDVSPAFAGKLQIEIADKSGISTVRTATVEFTPIAHIMPRDVTLHKLTHTVQTVTGLTFPVEEGTQIGSVTWYYKGKRIAETAVFTAAPLTAEDIEEPESIKPDTSLSDVEESNFLSVLWGIFKWVLIILLIAALIVVLGGGMFIFLQKRKARKARDAAFWERHKDKK